MSFNSKTLSLALAALGISSIAAFAGSYSITPDSRVGKNITSVKHVRQAKTDNAFNAFDVNEINTRARGNAARLVAPSDPTVSFEKIPSFASLEAPDGSVWFYTSKFKTEERATIPEFPDYTEDVVSSFTFTIYDAAFHEVGTISDKIDYLPNETRNVLIEIDPTLTCNFFNADDKIELMVYITNNTVEFVNNAYYNVYSLGGEKDDDGYDVPVTTFTGRLIDVVNVADKPGEEKFYFTFLEEAIDLDADYETYVDFLNAYVYRLSTFTKNVDGTGIKKIYEKDIYCTRIPGDTTDGIYFISKPHKGDLYLVYSQYEKPFFISPIGMDNEEQTPDNALTIEVVSLAGDEPRQVSFTSIPVPDNRRPDALIYTYLSIGSVAWTHDVDMTVNGTPEAPAFIVALDIQNAAQYDDLLSSSYDVYGADGKHIKNLAVDTYGMILFSADSNDAQPQIMFIYDKHNGSYDFRFANLYGGDVLFNIDQANGGDPISARCDRVRQADGSFKYAFEMTYYEKDETDNEFIRVAWFNGDGTFDRIDRIKVGKDVMAAQVNMAGSVLNPTLFDDDDKMEYAVLIKRSAGASILDEFVIVNDNNEWYARFSDEDGKGSLYTLGIVFGAEANQLMVIYHNYYSSYNIDLYDLPFDNMVSDSEGISDALVSGNAAIAYDGNVLAADGIITVYNSLGNVVARGLNSVAVDSLSKGVYMAVAADEAGNKATLKFIR